MDAPTSLGATGGCPMSGTLPPNQRRLIRNYLITWFIPSVGVATLLGGAVGFVVHDIAYRAAYSEAYDNARDVAYKAVFDEVLQITQVATQTTNNATTQLQNAQQMFANAKDTETKLEAEKSQIDQDSATARKASVDVQELVSGNYEQIAQELIAKQGFRSTLATVSQEALGGLQTGLAQLKSSLKVWDAGPEQTGAESRVSKCPDGTYAVGFAFQEEAGLAHGALWTGHIICRLLNVPP
jgi:flagellar biosynthesis chaperone FliJ